MKLLIALFAIGVVWSGCSKSCAFGGGTVSSEQYVNAMVALGCKGLQEGNPAADEVLKQNGVTPEQIQQFRKKSDFKVIAAAASEIASKVGACFNVNQ